MTYLPYKKYKLSRVRKHLTGILRWLFIRNDLIMNGISILYFSLPGLSINLNLVGGCG